MDGDWRIICIPIQVSQTMHAYSMRKGNQQTPQIVARGHFFHCPAPQYIIEAEDWRTFPNRIT